MTDTRRRTPRRSRDRWAAAGVVLLAVIAGLVAGHFGTRHAWENSTPTTQQGSR